MANETTGAVAKTEKKSVTLLEYADLILADVQVKLEKELAKGVTFPAGYNPYNALISASHAVAMAVDKNNQPALSVVTPPSVKQAVWQMLVRGLDPAKTQCYFIVYGNQLTLLESYFGAIMRAKRADPNIKDIVANIVYEGDKLTTDLSSGSMQIVSHIQDPDDIDPDRIKGAYATIIYRDGARKSEYMTIKMIRRAWGQGATKGESPAHKKFPEQMARKSVFGRLAKSVTNTSTGETLLDDDEADKIVAETKEAYDDMEASVELAPPVKAKQLLAKEVFDEKAQEPEEELNLFDGLID